MNGMRLVMRAKAENVALVRHALAGLAEAIGMQPEAVADLKTVVTEACMNVVLHAYEDGEGPLEVLAVPETGGLTVTVRDFGSGIRPRIELEGSSLRLGLPWIAALSKSFEIRGRLGEGTEVRMHLPLAREDAATSSRASENQQGPERGAKILIGPEELVAPVVSRVLSMLAARSEFGVDRLADAMLLGDAISAHASEGFADGNVQLVIEDGDGTVDVRLGPMDNGAGQRIRHQLELPALGSSIERLASEVSVKSEKDGEYLALRVAG